MKKLKKSIFIFLMLPVMFLCGCSKSNIKPQDFNAYFNDKVSCYIYKNNGTSSSKDISAKTLAASTPDFDYADKYISLEATAKGEWLYKMYVESIYFYVYTSHEAATEMIINVTLTNFVEEKNINNKNTTDEEKTLTAQCSFFPQEGNSTLCKVEVNRVVATATTTKIKFDINNSVHGILCTELSEPNDFKWLIDGLEIVGDSRTYNEK